MIYEVRVTMCRDCKQSKESSTKFFGSRKLASAYGNELETECLLYDNRLGWECKVYWYCYNTPKTKAEYMVLLEEVANRDE